MAFCTKCGTQLNQGVAFCTSCGNVIAGASANRISQQMHEEFAPLMGMGGKRFVFTDKSLIHGNDEYSYYQLSTINLLNAPIDALTNGVAEVTANGIPLTLCYAYNQREQFATAMTYANEQIDLAHGTVKNYKYIFQSGAGSKIEVYDDYLMLYYFKTSKDGGLGAASKEVSKKGGLFGRGLGKAMEFVGGIGTVMENTQKGGAIGQIIMFANLTAFGLNADNLIINEYSIPVSSDKTALVKEIIAYVEQAHNTQKTEIEVLPEDNELWEPIKGAARTFTLSGSVFEVPENLDVFNSYRLKFREFASKYADKAEKEYKSKIRDFVTFMEFSPKIYSDNLELIVKRATDILIAEEVWTVTHDSFMRQHIEDFHAALDDYEVMVESIEATVEANQQNAAGLMSFVPNLVGGGFGIKGAIKGIAMAEAFNLVRDGIENAAVKNAANINPAQQQELYARINPEDLLNKVYADYFNVYISLVTILAENGQDIWFPLDELYSKAANIFQNLSNPNFPQAKVTEAFLGILAVMPYDVEYYKWAVSKFGETEEVNAIRNYFGYADFDNPRCY